MLPLSILVVWASGSWALIQDLLSTELSLLKAARHTVENPNEHGKHSLCSGRYTCHIQGSLSSETSYKNQISMLTS